MMKYFITLVLLLMPTLALANEYSVRPGEVAKIALKLDYLRETMIILPERAVGVTGAGQPMYQVEPGGDYIMVRALKAGSRGNVFINFGNRTIVSLQLTTVAKGGEELVTLRYGAPPIAAQGKKVEAPKSSGSVQALAAPWNVKRLNSKSRNSGFMAVAKYAIAIGDKILVHFEIHNESHETLNIAQVSLARDTLGGMAGQTVLEREDIPFEWAMDSQLLKPGDDANGTIVFPKIYVDFDQQLVLRVQNDKSFGPELRIAL